jgi:hypothetical protein
MASIALRTRFSAQLVSALSEPPMSMFHVIGVLAVFAFPLFVAIEDTPALLVVVWPFLILWIMLVFAAREEVAELPKLYGDAVTHGEHDSVRELARLSHLAGIDRSRLDARLVHATARSGDPQRAIEIARAAIDRAVACEEAHAELDGALGVALALAGRHDEAITVLAGVGDGDFANEARRVLAQATPFRG